MDSTGARGQALIDAGWKARDLPGHMGHVGPLWTRREGDAWAYGLLADDRHLNPAGSVHGGAVATLLDHAMSIVAWEATGRRPCVTVQMNVQYLLPVRAGCFIEARGRIARGGSTLLFVSGSLVVEGVEVAQATAVMKVVGGG